MVDIYPWASPLGEIWLGATDAGLCICEFTPANPAVMRRFSAIPSTGERPAAIDMAISQLDEYFAGKRREFTVPMHQPGTQFQQEVWTALLNIPYGKTISYADLAAAVGRPKAYRAVAGACHANAIGIIVPCHRVIGSSSALTGYAGGLERKRSLLVFEHLISGTRLEMLDLFGQMDKNC